MEEVFDKAFVSYLIEAIGESKADVALKAMAEPPSVSIRLNPYKKINEEKGERTSQSKTPVPWSPYGFILSERPCFTTDPSFHSGAYYVQDSSAMFAGHLFRSIISSLPKIERPLRVLDLCAAPGGKTTDLAASLREAFGDSFILVANEISSQRAAVLSYNLARWGEPNVVVTSVDPGAFASMEGFFDIIIADVPCSGEGMFRKDKEALRQWSKDNVALCSARQRRITADVWPALAEGGIFIYSTCTFNKYENDCNVDWISKELGADVLEAQASYEGLFKTENGVCLIPGSVPGEGQYCAALRKTGAAFFKLKNHRPKILARNENILSLFRSKMILKEKGGTIIAVPEIIASEVAALSGLRPIMEGTAAGTLKGRDLVPHADLALCILLGEAFPRAEVDKETALAFLHKDAIALPEKNKGLWLICYGGLPLGFVKNLGNRCNNLLPQHRRIRMDIDSLVWE